MMTEAVTGRRDCIVASQVVCSLDIFLEKSSRTGCIGPSSGKKRPPQDDNSRLGFATGYYFAALATFTPREFAA
jgi:hypothetical protein